MRHKVGEFCKEYFKDIRKGLESTLLEDQLESLESILFELNEDKGLEEALYLGGCFSSSV